MIGDSGRVMACVALVLATGLGGCAQEQSAATAVGKRQAAAPPVASVPPVPTLLPAARDQSRSGAQEFAKYWFTALNYALQTGDIDPLRGASQPQCAACLDAIASVRNNYSDGGSLRGGTYTVRAVTVEEFSLDQRPSLTLYVDRSARSSIGPDGRIRESVPAEAFIACQLTVEWTGDGWRAAAADGDLLPSV